MMPTAEQLWQEFIRPTKETHLLQPEDEDLFKTAFCAGVASGLNWGLDATRLPVGKQVEAHMRLMAELSTILDPKVPT